MIEMISFINLCETSYVNSEKKKHYQQEVNHAFRRSLFLPEL